MSYLYYFITLLLSGLWLSCSSPKNPAQWEGENQNKHPVGYTTPVRGTWLTNIASDALYSRENIKKAVAYSKQLGLNSLFVVTWNDALTTYRSSIMDEFLGLAIDPALDPENEGRDPLRELIEEAHKEDMKVIAWFEFGFSSSYHRQGGPILDKKPDWACVTATGELCVKNNFDWMNALHPEVQAFIRSLVLEVMDNYDIDGIQGDDRLPAMPAEAGYDDFTVNKYRTAHNGQDPPTDRTDGKWREWRARIVNDFARDWYNAIKKENPRCLVSVSPSPLNFGFVEYLQDYETWVKEGICDMVHPQLYRRDFQGLGVYRGLLDSQIRRVGVHTDKFYPGLLSFLSGYVPDPEFLADMIRENRRRGIMGEVHFFYNVVLVRAEVLKAMYPAPATFPSFD